MPTALNSRGFAIDSANVYVLANGLIRAPLDGGPLTTLFDASTSSGGGGNPQRPHTIVVDSTSVYWTDFQNGTVMKLTPK